MHMIILKKQLTTPAFWVRLYDSERSCIAPIYRLATLSTFAGDKFHMVDCFSTSWFVCVVFRMPSIMSLFFWLIVRIKSYIRGPHKNFLPLFHIHTLHAWSMSRDGRSRQGYHCQGQSRRMRLKNWPQCARLNLWNDLSNLVGITFGWLLFLIVNLWVFNFTLKCVSSAMMAHIL